MSVVLLDLGRVRLMGSWGRRRVEVVCRVALSTSSTLHSSSDYARLGLPPTATKEEVKAAYFTLAKRLHPDNGGDSEQFNQLNEAYRRLLYQAQFTGPARARMGPEEEEELERRRRGRRWAEEQWRRMEEERSQGFYHHHHQRERSGPRDPGFGGFYGSKFHPEGPAGPRGPRAHGQGPRGDHPPFGPPSHPRDAMMWRFTMQVVLLFFILSLLLAPTNPSPCHLYSQGCNCAQCLRYHRMVEERRAVEHQRPCRCDLCSREDTRGFHYTSK